MFNGRWCFTVPNWKWFSDVLAGCNSWLQVTWGAFCFLGVVVLAPSREYLARLVVVLLLVLAILLTWLAIVTAGMVPTT